MDFRLSEEQQQFADSLQRWIARDYSFEARQKIVASAPGVSDPAYAALTELGALALAVPEAAGGLGGSPEDLMIVMKEIGRGLVIEPYFATVLAAEFLRLGGRTSVLEQVAAGTIQLACALNEKEAGHELFNIAVTARADGDAYVLQGSKCAVIHGAQADALVVSVRTSGGPRDQDGISLLYVPRGTPGMTVTEYRSYDGQRAASVVFDQARLPATALIGQAGKGWEILEAATDFGVVLLCAEAVGAMEAANALTLDYLKTRQQFGVPIGTFQVLQHRMADMCMHAELAKSITILATVKAHKAPANERRRLVSAAKVRVGKAMQFIGQQAIQMHGGMGMTNEMSIAHYFKRLTAIETTLGNTDFHRTRFTRQPEFAEV